MASSSSQPGGVFTAKNGWEPFASVAMGLGYANVPGARGIQRVGVEAEEAASAYALGILAARDDDGTRLAAIVWPGILPVVELDDKSKLHAALVRAGIAGLVAPPTVAISWDVEQLPADSGN